jgi:hypothetical protein
MKKTSNQGAINYGSTAIHTNISIILNVDGKKLPEMFLDHIVLTQ